MPRSFFLICVVFGSIPGLCQDWFFNKSDHLKDTLPQKRFLQIRYQTGGIANTNTPAVGYIESNPFQSIDFRYGIYGYGRKMWQQLHHYPTYGLGVGKYFFQPNDNIIGNPVTTYLFFNESLFRFKKSSIGYDLSIGVAYGWKPYDPVTNPDQLVIGSAVTGLMGLNLQYDFILSNRLDATLGMGLNHFSNGRIRSPNRGLNLYGVNFSVRYRLAPSPISSAVSRHGYKKPEPVPYSIESFRPFYEFYLVGSIGVTTTFQDKDKPDLYFMTGSATLDIARHYGYKGKYGFGLDWSYDESLKEVYQADYPSGVPNSLLYWPGIHLSHEYMIHRWTIVTQAGVNLKDVGDKGLGFGRLAFRYDVSQSIFLRAGLRVYKTVVSDFIEWGVGYSFYKKNSHP